MIIKHFSFCSNSCQWPRVLGDTVTPAVQLCTVGLITMGQLSSLWARGTLMLPLPQHWANSSFNGLR